MITDARGRSVADSDTLDRDRARLLDPPRDATGARRGRGERHALVGDVGHEAPLRRAAGRIGGRHPGRGAHHVSRLGDRRPDPPHLVAARGDRWRRARHRVPGQPPPLRLDDQAARRSGESRRRAGRGRAVGARRGAQGPGRADRPRRVVQRDRGAPGAARGRAARLRGRRVPSAAHAARSHAAAAREPRGRRRTAPPPRTSRARWPRCRGCRGSSTACSCSCGPSSRRPSPAPIVVEDVLDGRCDAWDAFAAEKHVHIDASVAGTPVASATPGRLEQVVDNLLNNALEVAPPRAARCASSPGASATGSSCGSATKGRGCRPRSAPTRSSGSGSRARPGATVAPTVTSASGSRSCASSWSVTAVTSRSAPSEGGGLEVVVRMKRSHDPVAPRARQLSTASAT